MTSYITLGDDSVDMGGKFFIMKDFLFLLLLNWGRSPLYIDGRGGGGALC